MYLLALEKARKPSKVAHLHRKHKTQRPPKNGEMNEKDKEK